MKLTRREIKVQEELIKLLEKEKLTDEDKENFYTNFNPGYIDNLSQGVYFTPYYLAQDVAVFAPRKGYILDLCAGIGMLSHRLHDMNSYNRDFQDITCVEMNPKFVEIGKKLLPEANWICSNVFEEGLIDNLLKEKGIDKFDLIISNPPFGKMIKQDIKPNLNYMGSLDLMVLELCLKYAKNGYYILPSNSAPFRYSGAPYYQDNIGRELNRFIKANKGYDFTMTCDGIDCSIFKDEWKNLNGIGVEAVNIDIYPYSMYTVEDSITRKV